MGRQTRVVAPSRAILNPKERAIHAILAVPSGMFKQISEAYKHFGCNLNSYSYHVKGSAGTIPLESFNLTEIKESVKATAPAAAPAAAATAPTAFNYMIYSQAPIFSIITLRAIKPRLNPGAGYMKKGFGFENYRTVMEWAGKEATDGPLGYRGFTLAVHPNTFGKAKRRLLVARA